MSCAGEFGEDGDRFIVLVGGRVTEREVEVCREFVRDAALGGKEMRNGFGEVALSREVGAGLKLIVGGGGCARVVGRRLGLGLLAAHGALRWGGRARAKSD